MLPADITRHCTATLDAMERLITWTASITLALVATYAFGGVTIRLAATTIPNRVVLTVLPLIYAGIALHYRRLVNILITLVEAADSESHPAVLRVCHLHTGMFNPFAYTARDQRGDAVVGIILLTAVLALHVLTLLLFYFDLLESSMWFLVVGAIVAFSLVGWVAAPVTHAIDLIVDDITVAQLKAQVAVAMFFIEVPAVTAIIVWVILLRRGG
jgi:hypothetical protein